MPEPVVTDQPITQEKAAAATQQYNENELDDALNKAFNKDLNAKTSDQAKTVEPEQKAPVEKSSAEPQKNADAGDKVKPEVQERVSAPEGEKLPSPDTIGDAPAKSGKNREGWEALKGNYRTAHKIAEDRAAEIIKLKKEVAEKVQGSTKETEALKQQIAELNKYRAMVDIQADPEFISKYDEPIKKNTDSIKGLLKSLQVSDQIVDTIDFSNTQGVAKLMDQVVDWVGEHRDKFTSRKLQRQVEDLMDLTDKRNEMLNEHKSNYQKHLEDKKKENFSRGAEEEGRMLARFDQIIAAKDPDQKPIFGFLNKQDVPEGSNSIQIQQIEGHNGLVDAMNNRIKEYMRNTKPEDKMDIAVAAAASHYFSAQLKQAQARIKSLEEEVKKISTTSEETPKTKIRTASNGQFASKSDMNADEALAAHFNR